MALDFCSKNQNYESEEIRNYFGHKADTSTFLEDENGKSFSVFFSFYRLKCWEESKEIIDLC